MRTRSNSGTPSNCALVGWGVGSHGGQHSALRRYGTRILQAFVLAFVCLALLGAGSANRSAEARFNDLGHKLMCKCGCNQILLECNHVGCSYSTQMRDELTAALTRGGDGQGSSTPDSDELVLQSFVQKYGATVLAAPTTSGFNIVAWIVPFVALLAGITLVAVIARKWKFRLQPV